MNKIVNKFLLVGDLFTPEFHLRQPGFTFSARAPFNKNHKRVKNSKKQAINYVKQIKIM